MPVTRFITNSGSPAWRYSRMVAAIGEREAKSAPLMLRLLLILFAWTTLPFWLPTVRSAFDGPTYQWELFGFRGEGLAGDYWFVLLGSALSLCVQALGWRGWRGRRTVASWLLLGWFGLLTAGAVHLALTAPQSFRFRGDTLGLDFSLAWAAPLLLGAAAAMAAALLLTGGSREPAPRRWTRRNAAWAAALLGALPLQLALLRLGQPHGLTDQAGVVITIVQWLLAGRALRP